MLFEKIVGQEAVKNDVINMWRNQHLPHAILVLGKEGTGGLPFALAMSQYILCENKQEHDACGTCPNCAKVQRLEHADLHFSFPSISPKAGAKAMSLPFIAEFREFVRQSPYGTTYDWLQYINAENKQGNISAEECREIINNLNLKSYEGGKKIQLIWRPEYLGKEGNILLKLIEEPPADTVIILIAENLEAILPTILSRTQIIKLPPLPPQAISKALQERNNTDPEKAAQIAYIADGSYTEALQLLQSSENDLFPEIRRWFNGIFTNNGIEMMKFVEDWSKNGREQQKNFLQYVIQLLEQAIRSIHIPDYQPSLPAGESAFIRKLAERGLAFETYQKMIGFMSETIYFIERNANSKAQLLALSIKLGNIIKGREIVV